MNFGFSTKQHGQMKVIDGKLTPEVQKNRQAFLNEFGLNSEKTVSAVLEHGSHVELITSTDAGAVFPNTDAFITQDPKVVLTITAADCLPIYFFDQTTLSIGIAHAGWKGVLREVVVKTLEAMEKNFKNKPENVQTFIGPHLKKCHFEVKDDVLQKFTAYLEANSFSVDFISPAQLSNFHSSTLSAGEPLLTGTSHFIDLASIVSAQLQKAGVLAENIKVSQECTFELPQKYFSYRRDKPAIVEAQLAFITLK